MFRRGEFSLVNPQQRPIDSARLSSRFAVDLIYHPDVAMKRATVQCLHAMTTHGEEFWHPLLETGTANFIDAK